MGGHRPEPEAGGGRACPPSGKAGTRGFAMQGDTAVVRVEYGTHDDSQPSITTYIETNRYLFVRDGTGWRYLRHEFVSGADAGRVRGR